MPDPVKFYQTDDYALKWMFLTDEMVHIAGFGSRESAEGYGTRNGYDVSAPIKISMSKVREMQASRKDAFSTNSAIPKFDPNAGAGVAERKAPMRRAT